MDSHSNEMIGSNKDCMDKKDSLDRNILDKENVEEVPTSDECSMEGARKLALSHKENGHSNFQRKNYKKAITAYTEGLKQKHKDQTMIANLYKSRGHSHFNLGDYRNALSDATWALKYVSDNKKFHSRVILLGAKACLELGNYDECVEWCQKGLLIYPGERNIMSLEKRAEYKKEKEANLAFDDGYDMEDPYDRMLSYLHEGNYYVKKQDFKKAVTAYTKALNENVGNGKLKSRLYANRANAHGFLGNIDESYEDCMLASKHENDYFECVFSKADAYLYSENYEKCIYWCCMGIKDGGGGSEKFTEFINLRRKAYNQELAAEKELENCPQKVIKRAKPTEKYFHCATFNCLGFLECDKVNDFKCEICGHENCIACQAVHNGQTCKEYQEEVKLKVKRREDAKKTEEAIEVCNT